MSHKHMCERCNRPFPCREELERNFDGIPDPVCERHKRADFTCPQCAEQFDADNARELAEQEAEG